MNPILITVAVAGLLALVVIVAATVVVSRLYRKVPQGKAMVVSTTRNVTVTFTGRVVLPIFHHAEIMDISVKTIEVDRRGSEGLICQDNIRADIKVNFFVRVNKAEEDVVKVAQAIGTQRASDIVTLEELFAAKFSEALKTVGKQMEFVSLYTERATFRDRIIQVIGTDLNGYALEDVAIDYLEQTPLAQLDSGNILDAQGIRKITELTAIERIATNIAANDERKHMTAKNVETNEAVLQLERQQADAEARHAREVASVRIREEAVTARIEAEERLATELARLDVEQKLGIQDENRQREVQVAAKNRERIIAIEDERVGKARELEAMTRRVETLSAEKGLEQELSAIADIRRDRVAVERTVAEQEEQIETLRVVSEANRRRDAVVIEAEAEAQGALVRDIKAAEAAEAAAAHLASEQITMARAELDAADFSAQAQIRRAAGAQATAAASGLAEAEVREAEAVANEKLGLAEIRVEEARAAAVRELGMAEAAVVEAKLRSEASGLTDKAAAMRELEGVGQAHEEFVRKLEADTRVRLAEVEASVGVATAQAEAMKAGLESADIDIVGGSDLFIDRMVGAIGAGRSLDGFVDGSRLATGVVAPYTNGDRDLVATLAEAIAGLGADGVRDLSVADLLRRIGHTGD